MAQPASATASAPAPATAADPVAAVTPTLTTTVSGGTVSPAAVTAAAWFTGVGGILSLLFLFIFHFGAAKLSYDLNQSFGWGFLSFLFASVYYPYYAFVHSSRREAPSVLSSIIGGRRRKH